MEIDSLGWRTDVRLRQLEGARVEERADHLVIRTEANPGYRWGNFLLLRSPVYGGGIERWIDRFQAVFPAADYVALGIDSRAGNRGAEEELIAAGLSIDVDTVLSARALRTPARAPAGAEFRALESERDWQQVLELGASPLRMLRVLATASSPFARCRRSAASASAVMAPGSAPSQMESEPGDLQR
jgi:hypothetical protein